jgi:outer membrane protein insertion porin family/translocation and assembly module TamA
VKPVVIFVLFLLFLFAGAISARAIPLDALDSSREWLVKDLTISGNKQVSTGDLEEILLIKERPWYAFWHDRPRFDPEAFAADLQKIERFYQSAGFYEVKVAHDLQVDYERELVSVKVIIDENRPVIVKQISIEIVDRPELKELLESERRKFALQEGKTFTEEAYQGTATAIRDFFFDRGRARVEVGRKAEVLADEGRANVFYRVTAGPQAVFGETKIQGLKDVTSDVVERELTYKPGDIFSGKALRDSRRNLLQLDLFSEIELQPELSSADTGVVPIETKFKEKPPHEIRIGIGYGTEDQLRGQVRWRNNNFLGGARQLELGAKASFIARELDARFVQPHFLGQNNRFTASFGPKQFEEPGYTLNATRFLPRLERKFSDKFSAFVGYRGEYDRLEKVPRATIRALDPFDRKGWLSAFSIGSVWNTTDDRANPTVGSNYSLLVEQAGSIWGGSYDFVKMLGDARWYFPLAAKTVLASRMRLGFAEPIDGGKEVPLFERFFAGGGDSVRGYKRRFLGPLSRRDDPLGGRSLLEGSVELRQQQIYKQLGAVVFIDFGQVSRRSFDPPVGNLKFAGGYGIRYPTPIGPLRLDFGFPFQRRSNDRAWQVFFDIGQTF